ncbi:histidine kinase [Metabacillus sp. GX 13764]|uniref:histidine kinase n=1 Tax=Metabacillus kandeliae TaxID=2900151 RepID=UPI001E2DEB6F|nr:histidine kinase [Metabacillus kandeliae]MCD7035730.1 histidine kinase [Metabacillus kandeliae]
MRQNSNKLYIIIITVSIILTGYVAYLNLTYPFVGANVAFNDKNQLVITEVDPNAWAAKENLEKGDIILKINKNDPHFHSTIYHYGLLEQVTSLEIQNEHGIKRIISSPDSIILSYQGLFLFVIPLILFFLCLFCVYFVFKTNKNLKLKSAFLLNIFLLSIGLSYLTASGSARADLYMRYANLSLFLLVPVSYLHFLYQYFIELGKKLFSYNFVILSYFIVGLNIFIEITQGAFHLKYEFLKGFNLSSFFILMTLSLLLKIIGLKKVKYSEQEYFVKVLIITNIVAFSPFLLLYILPYILFQKYIFSPVILASFLLLIPFSLVYQFLATKIYDIEFILGRLRYYALLAVLPSIVCVAIMLILKDDDSDPTFLSIKLLIYVYLVILLMFYLKEILDFRFRFKRFSEKYNYQDSIFKYTNSIRKASKLDYVITELKKTIIDVTLVNKAFLVQLYKDNQTISSIDNLEEEYSQYITDIEKVSSEVGKIIEVDKGFIINVGDTDNRVFIIVCLSILNTPRLTRDEISWLKTLAFYTNVSLENFLKIEQLMDHLETIEQEGTNPAWLTKLLFSIEEKQRSNLAKDLHDSVLQDLISLKRQCELAIADMERSPMELRDDLDGMNENMTKIINTTRETCQELRPQLLYDLGLVKALNKLVSQVQETAKFDIRLNSGNFQATVDIDTQLNLYRIVQELLSNANKHSKAQNVLIMLVSIKDKIVLHYEDNGVGYDRGSLSYNTTSMGLSGISERVKALKGTLTIDTSPGNGFKAVVEI